MTGTELSIPGKDQEAAHEASIVNQFIDASKLIVPTVEVSLAKRIVRPDTGRVLCLAARTTIPLSETDAASMSDIALKLSDGTNIRLSLSFFDESVYGDCIPLHRSIYNPNKYEPRAGASFNRVFAGIGVLAAGLWLYLVPGSADKILGWQPVSTMVSHVKGQLATISGTFAEAAKGDSKAEKALPPSKIEGASRKVANGIGRTTKAKRTRRSASRAGVRASKTRTKVAKTGRHSRSSNSSSKKESRNFLVPPPPPVAVSFPYPPQFNYPGLTLPQKASETSAPSAKQQAKKTPVSAKESQRKVESATQKLTAGSEANGAKQAVSTSEVVTSIRTPQQHAPASSGTVKLPPFEQIIGQLSAPAARPITDATSKSSTQSEPSKSLKASNNASSTIYFSGSNRRSANDEYVVKQNLWQDSASNGSQNLSPNSSPYVRTYGTGMQSKQSKAGGTGAPEPGGVSSTRETAGTATRGQSAPITQSQSASTLQAQPVAIIKSSEGYPSLERIVIPAE